MFDTRVIIGIAISIVVVFFALLVWASASYHQGVEFSPDDFSSRSFEYYQDPMTGFIFRGRTYSATYDNHPDLVTDKLISPRNISPKTWHLISEKSSWTRSISHDCDARFLYVSLNQLTEDQTGFWEDWNSNYADHAKILWPLIAEMARDDLYLTLCKVMDAAAEKSATANLDDFEAELNQMVADAYLEQGIIDLGMDRAIRAKYRLEKSHKIDPNPATKAMLDQIPSGKDATGESL
jgi:hypothetical protein